MCVRLQGIVEKVMAMHTLLEKFPQWRSRVVLFEVLSANASSLPIMVIVITVTTTRML